MEKIRVERSGNRPGYYSALSSVVRRYISFARDHLGLGETYPFKDIIRVDVVDAFVSDISVSSYCTEQFVSIVLPVVSPPPPLSVPFIIPAFFLFVCPFQSSFPSPPFPLTSLPCG